MSKLVCVEWGSDGKVCRLVHEKPVKHKSVLDQLIQGVEGSPHRLTEWDVDWCERDQCYYVRETGGWTGRVYLNGKVEGYRSRLWAADHVQFSHNSSKGEMLTPEQVRELGYDRVDLDEVPEDLSRTCEEICVYWCDECQDMIPDNDTCEHMKWCDDCGCVVGVNECTDCG